MTTTTAAAATTLPLYMEHHAPHLYPKLFDPINFVASEAEAGARGG